MNEDAPRGGGPAAAASPFKSTSGLKRIMSAAGYSCAGLLAAYRHEHAFRQELWIAMPLVVIAGIVDVGAAMRALMIASVLAVLIVELLNSAVEAVVDRISLDHHPLAGRAKDLGSAAVFLAIANAVVVWLIGLLS
ncbi:MAG: diacylglycerol kinase [Burkholderiales bacterium]